VQINSNTIALLWRLMIYILNGEAAIILRVFKTAFPIYTLKRFRMTIFYRRIR
jgi:hypothetical protein